MLTTIREGSLRLVIQGTGNMVKWRVKPYVRHKNMAWEWEIQAAFFEFYNIQPKWLHANQIWGTLNDTTGQWSGAVGMIQKDEADYTIGPFAGTYGRSKVAAFSPGTDYEPRHWLTRYPLELPPTWNLLGLFTKGYISQTVHELSTSKIILREAFKKEVYSYTLVDHYWGTF